MPLPAKLASALMLMFVSSLPVVQAAPLVAQHPNALDTAFADADCDPCGGDQQSIADNFVMTEAGQIASIRLWGGYAPANLPIFPDVFSYAIYANNAGLPAAAPLPACQQDGLAASRINTGVTVFGLTRFEYQLTPTTACKISQPGIYWIEIFNNTAASTEGFFWETGEQDPDNGMPGAAVSATAPGVAWNVSNNDFAFELSDVAASCSPTPLLGCTVMYKAVLRAKTLKRKLVFAAKGDVPDLGDPSVADAQSTCVYDKHANLIADLSVEAGGINGRGKPYWRLGRHRIRYGNRVRNQNGVKVMSFKVGYRIKTNARGDKVNFARPFAFPVTVQHSSHNGNCLEAVFNAGLKTKKGIKAKLP